MTNLQLAVRIRLAGPTDPAGHTIAEELSRDSLFVRLHPPTPRFTAPTWRTLLGTGGRTAGVAAESAAGSAVGIARMSGSG